MKASPVEVAAPAPIIAAPAPVAARAPAAAIAPASVATQDLDSLLSAAGLTLASTDPAKLRAAQEQTTEVAAQARPRRERKPLPPPVDEPLVQIDTRR